MGTWAGVIDDASTSGLRRVFVHPSSVNFSNTAYRPSNFVLYGERQLSVSLNAHAATPNEKAYICDVSEISPLPLLFFGGVLEAQYVEGTVSVDGWIRFAAPGKIVALVQALRRAFDALLLDKIDRPHECDVESSVELRAVCRLLASDGLG